MLLSIKEMERKKLRFQETFQPGQIDFSAEELEQISQLEAQGTAELLAHSEGEVRLECTYTVEMGSACDRCLAPARYPLKGTLDLYYQPMSAIAKEEEIEIDEGEAEIAFYEGGGIELKDVLREQILLALPMQRLCREDCKGICPQCGKNRNEGGCECVPEAGEPRWEGLRNLRMKPSA